MKVLHICESIIGGTGSYLSEIVPHQVEKYGSGNVILLIPESQISYLEKRITDCNPVIISFKRSSRLSGTVRLYQQYLSALRRLKPTIVHAHSSIAGLVTRLAPRGRDVSVIFCPHGWAFEITNSPLLRVSVRLFERLAASLTDRILVISQYEYTRARQIGIPEERLILLRNGIDAKVPDVEPAIWEDGRLKVLFVGRLDRQKGLDILLGAVSLVEDKVALRVVGEVAVDKMHCPREDTETVRYLGWLDRDQVASQLKACDILVIPSRWEGFGLVAIEAMRMSVPFIASQVGGLREISEGEVFCFPVPPEDPEALRDCLLSLPLDELKERGRVGYERFVEFYTSARLVNEIDALYESLDRTG